MPKISELVMPESLHEAIEENPHIKAFIEADSDEIRDALAKADGFPSADTHVTTYQEEGRPIQYKLNFIGLCAQLGLQEHVDYLFEKADSDTQKKVLENPGEYNLLRAIYSCPDVSTAITGSVVPKLTHLAKTAMPHESTQEKEALRLHVYRSLFNLISADNFALLGDVCARGDVGAANSILRLYTVAGVGFEFLPETGAANREILQSRDYQMFKLMCQLRTEKDVELFCYLQSLKSVEEFTGSKFRYDRMALAIISSSPHPELYLTTLCNLLVHPNLKRSATSSPDDSISDIAKTILHMLSKYPEFKRRAAEAAAGAAGGAMPQKSMECMTFKEVDGMIRIKQSAGRGNPTWNNLYKLQSENEAHYQELLKVVVAKNDTKRRSAILQQVYDKISSETYSSAEALWQAIDIHGAFWGTRANMVLHRDAIRKEKRSSEMSDRYRIRADKAEAAQLPGDAAADPSKSKPPGR